MNASAKGRFGCVKIRFFLLWAIASFMTKTTRWHSHTTIKLPCVWGNHCRTRFPFGFEECFSIFVRCSPFYFFSTSFLTSHDLCVMLHLIPANCTSTSAAECQMFDLMFDLFKREAPSDWIIFYSLKLDRFEREIDFVVLALGFGVFCLEVISTFSNAGNFSIALL
jgi:hypothetical protein